ncbi:MAG TPA: SPOR domain-containing protein [Acidobacteriota bacterium]|nr:SPOR domain-containing protein [Acidobacteriota bacterium]
MKKLESICSLVSLLVVLAWAASCTSPRAVRQEGRTERPPTTLDARGFNPLELPRDTEIVPLEHPRAGAVTGRQALVGPGDFTPVTDTAAPVALDVPEVIDTVNSQAYRVQIFTSKLFGEARRAAVIAEEIFDRPVFVDYEVPYFKVRVGNFDSRDRAEAYLQKTRAAGYNNAWVVMVTLNVREAPGLYENLPILGPSPDSTVSDSVQYDEDGY